MNNSKHNMDVTSAGYASSARWFAGLCAAALLVPGLAGAATWEIAPTRIELSPEQQTSAITLKNTSDTPTSIQIQVVAWSQVDGKDIYTPSRELLVSPPFVTIPAQGEQIIRAALRRPADASKELSYRINLQELPPPAAPGITGVQMALRIGLPVFVQAQEIKAAPKMAWSAMRMPDSSLKITLENHGNAHVQITDFSLFLPGDEQAIGGEVGSSYVMPGQTHEWLLKSASLGKKPNGRLRLKAYTDAGDVDTDLVLGKP